MQFRSLELIVMPLESIWESATLLCMEYPLQSITIIVITKHSNDVLSISITSKFYGTLEN